MLKINIKCNKVSGLLNDLEQDGFWKEEVIAATAKMLRKKIVVHTKSSDSIRFQQYESTEGANDTDEQINNVNKHQERNHYDSSAVLDRN